jgi:hypothetical protein
VNNVEGKANTVLIKEAIIKVENCAKHHGAVLSDVMTV